METAVTYKWSVLWFPPDGDARRVFTSESSARKFAASWEVEEWNPLLERQTITTVSKLVKL